MSTKILLNIKQLKKGIKAEKQIGCEAHKLASYEARSCKALWLANTQTAKPRLGNNYMPPSLPACEPASFYAFQHPSLPAS